MCSERLSALVVALLIAAAAVGQSRLKPREAMLLRFPDCVVTQRTIALAPAQRDSIAKKSREKRPRPMVYCYQVHRQGALIAIGYVDAHIVRTKKQVLLVIVGTQGENRGRVRRVEVLAFAEPRQYRPAGRFYEQFQGMKLCRELREGRKIKRVTGATMTTRATTAAVRRILATHSILAEKRQ